MSLLNQLKATLHLVKRAQALEARATDQSLSKAERLEAAEAAVAIREEMRP